MQTYSLQFLSYRPTYSKSSVTHCTSHQPYNNCTVSQRSWFVVHLVCRFLFVILQDPLHIKKNEQESSGGGESWVICVEGEDSAFQGKENGGDNVCPWRMYWCLLLWHLIMVWVYGFLVLSSCVIFHLPPLCFWYVRFVFPGPVVPLCCLILASWFFVLCWFVVCSVFCSWINLVLFSDNRTGLSHLFGLKKDTVLCVCVCPQNWNDLVLCCILCICLYCVYLSKVWASVLFYKTEFNKTKQTLTLVFWGW